MNGRTTLRSNYKLLGCFVCMLFILASCNQKALRETTRPAPAKPFFPVTEAGADPSSKCLYCHDYQQNHHPIDIAPADPADYPFPLFDGKIKCLTCHVDDHDASSKLLRGGPYRDRREICFQCHSEDEYSKIDPHKMLDDNGKIVVVNGRPVCLVCHAVEPNPAKDRTGDVRFRADIAFLCWRCHATMVNAMFFQTHFLSKPSLKMVKFIEKNSEELELTIPLVPRERLTCSTCHNPHQKGVITYEPSSKGADEPGRLRLPSPEICFVCHDVQ
jgi:predicted CXXCH cytochrome family protein